MSTINVSFDLCRLLRFSAESFANRLKSFGLTHKELVAAGLAVADEMGNRIGEITSRVNSEVSSLIEQGICADSEMQAAAERVFSEAGASLADEYHQVFVSRWN